MKTIFKYPLQMKQQQVLKLPNNAQILHVGEQKDNLFLWAKVDTSKEDEARKIEIYGTGHEANEYDLEFINTVQMSNGLVFHVFENK